MSKNSHSFGFAAVISDGVPEGVEKDTGLSVSRDRTILYRRINCVDKGMKMVSVMDFLSACRDIGFKIGVEDVCLFLDGAGTLQ